MGLDSGMKQALLVAEQSGDRGETINLCGTEFTKNGWPWHFAVLFKLPVTESDKKAFDAQMEKPEEVWDKCFTHLNKTAPLPSSVKDGITKKQFHHEVFNEIVHILGGDRNGLHLDPMLSIDEDELILKIGLIDPQAKKDLADVEDLSVRLSEVLYTTTEAQMPTNTKLYSGNEGNFEPMPDAELDGAPIPNTYPAYMNFSIKHADKFEEIGELDCIRLARRRLVKFINMNELVDHGIISQWFPVHHWDDLDDLRRKGWNDPLRIFQWPKEARSDAINKYFGPEIAFFFHWFNHLTRWLAFPAILSIFTYGAGKSGLCSRVHMNYVSMAFAAMLIVWSSIYTSRYRQAKNLKQYKWGMDSFGASAWVARKEFRDAYRDSLADYMQHFFHWFMVVFFVCETVLVVYYCTHLQVQARANLQGKTHVLGIGIDNQLVANNFAFLITINIKLVDKVWTSTSNWLTNQENWRSVQELQQSMVAKMFSVKVFVFYYPFVYIIMIKPYTKGCGPTNSHDDLTGCVDELNASLIVFFFSQVAIEVALIVVYLGIAAWAVRSEKKRYPNREYTYLELQAKTMPYTDEDLIADFLNAVVTYGYIILFGVSLPCMCLVGMASNLVMIRLVAYKVSYAYQRPMPKAMDGIGTWERVIHILGYFGVVTNAYIAVFTLNIFSRDNLGWNIAALFILQNVGMGMKMAIEGLYDERNSAHKRILEHHADIMDKLMDEQDPVKIGNGQVSTAESPFQWSPDDEGRVSLRGCAGHWLLRRALNISEDEP